MTQERLTDLGILYIEKNIVKILNLDVVINYFATKHKNRKIAFFNEYCSIIMCKINFEINIFNQFFY